MRKTLTRQQRASIFAEGAPRITGKGRCPWQPGDVYRVSSNISLTVLEVKKPKPQWKAGKRVEDDWMLRYHILDRRDPVSLIRRNPHPMDLDAIRDELEANGGYPLGDPDDPAVLRDAAIESAYTFSKDPDTTLVDAGERVDEATLARFSDEARDRLRRERQGEYDRKMAKARASSLREVELRARQRGIDVSSDMAQVDAVVSSIRRKLENGGREAA